MDLVMMLWMISKFIYEINEEIEKQQYLINEIIKNKMES